MYYSKLPKALKRLAFRSTLTLKGSDGQVRVVDDFDFEQPSTKSFKGVIDACGLNGQKVLFITPKMKMCWSNPVVTSGRLA